MHQRQVVTQRPVSETVMQEKRYKVAKPVTETSHREERTTVMRPVWETRYKDMSYNRVRYVNETSSRTERRVVQKPVYETSMREERRVVQKPVTQTVMQDQTTTAMVPTTTYRQQLVDRGQFVDQMAYKPGEFQNRLKWQSRGCYTNPATGQNQFRRAGLFWVPEQKAGTWTANKVYVPNVGVQQIAETQYLPQQYTRKVAIPVTSYVSEVQARKVPVQSVRMVQEEQLRQVPVTTQRPVVERVTNYVPERVCKWVPQEMVRRVPVTTQRIVYEERVEQVPVTTTRMVAEYKTVEVPQTTSRWVPETTMRQVPRTILMKVPITPVCETVSGVSFESSTSTPASVTAATYTPPIQLVPDTDSNHPPIVEELTPATEPTLAPAESADDGWRPRAPVLELGPSARDANVRSAAREGGWRIVAKSNDSDIRLSRAK
jgi:hypothetical protein